MWHLRRRKGTPVARCTVERLVRKQRLRSVRRCKQFIATRPDGKALRPQDRVNRDFTACRTNQLWVVDVTYVPTWSGMAFTAFVTGVIQHSEAGAQHTAIRYANRLADAGAIASIGTVGDSYDNALAESAIGLYRSECVKIDGPFCTVGELELATLSWVHWFNENRLHSSIGCLNPIETQNAYYREGNARQKPLRGELALH